MPGLIAPLFLAAGLAASFESSTQLVLKFSGNVEKNVVSYTCEGMTDPLSVEYINSQPTFLAIVPVNGQNMLFVNVMSGSGARYASGQYEWWSAQGSATLTDLTAAEGTKPVSCTEQNQTP